MKLKDNLFNIQEKNITEDAARYAITLNSKSVIYTAHFPGHPITPGVCVIQIVKELLEDYTGKNLSISSISNAKFLSVIQPCEQILSVTLSKVNEENGIYSLQSIISEEDGPVYAKISLKAVVAR
mgnify:CR=1 FL=1